jgi:hypothetical protein
VGLAAIQRLAAAESKCFFSTTTVQPVTGIVGPLGVGCAVVVVRLQGNAATENHTVRKVFYTKP